MKEKIIHWFGNNWFKICFLLIILFGIFGYLYVRNSELADKAYRDSQDRLAKDERVKELNNCLSLIDPQNYGTWQAVQDVRNNCFKQYPQN